MKHKKKSHKRLFSQDKDQYGNEVQKMARPLPVEYLLVDVPASSPLTPLYTFPSQQHRFPIENRSMIFQQLQDFSNFHQYMQKYTARDFLTVFGNISKNRITLFMKIITFRQCQIFTSCFTFTA